MKRAWALIAVALAGCGAAAPAMLPAPRARATRATAASTTSADAKSINPAAIPLGDGHVSTSPRVGYVDSCITQFPPAGGAQVDGPWINTKVHTWDERTKIAVSGMVHWPNAYLHISERHGRRIIVFDDLPVTHTSGTFPISPSDPAYAYDRNPNQLAAQHFDWSLPLHPKAARTPGCTPGGPIGVLRDGVALFNALDGEGRDAAAHEVLDACGAHPDMSSTYHHHDIPPCILDRTRAGRATLVGYALDGYGIYVVKDRAGRLPTDRDLDACHGTVSRVPWNGRTVRIFHYVATLEYPYTVGCFHGTPITTAIRARRASNPAALSGP